MSTVIRALVKAWTPDERGRCAEAERELDAGEPSRFERSVEAEWLYDPVSGAKVSPDGYLLLPAALR